MDLATEIERLAEESSFSGAVRVERGDDVVFAKAYGLADRARGVPNNLDTIFGIADMQLLA